MSTALDWSLWKPFFVTLTLGTTFVFLATLVAQRWIQSMIWRRTAWQIAFLSVGLLAIVELSGTNRIAIGWLWEPNRAPADGMTLVESKVIGEPDPPLLLTANSRKASRATDTVSKPLAQPLPVWWPTVVWLAGVSVVLGWMTILRLCFCTLVHRRVVRNEALLARVDAIARRLGLSQRIRVTEARRLAGPIAYGIVRPGISLPEGFASRHSTEQQDVMLAHELAHLAARDPLWHTLADIVMSLVWWHPLAWPARRELHTATEGAADEASLVVENGPAALAECLVELGKRLTHPRSLGWLGMEGSGFRSGLGKRVKRLVTLDNQSWNRPSRTRLWLARGLASAPLVVLALMGTAWARPESPAAETLRQAFQRSVLGIALTAAMPAAPNEPINPKPTATVNANAETPAPAPIPSPVSTVPSTELHTRMFRIDPSTFRRSLANIRSLPFGHTNAAAQIVGIAPQTNSPVAAASSGLNQMLKDTGNLLNKAGVDFSMPGKQLLFIERNETLMVRATLQDLDIVEQAIQILNMPPPQLTIEVKFCEVTTKGVRNIGLGWLLDETATNRQAHDSSSATNSQSKTILTESQYRDVFRVLEKEAGVDILHAPKITTLSGRQAQMKSVRSRYIVTDLDWSYHGTNSVGGTNDRIQAQPIAEPFELGPVLDVVPYVLADGQTIQMTLIPTLTEFLGYDPQKTNRQETVTMPDGRKEIVTVPVQPLPIFRKLQMVSSAIVRDGQTVVIAGGSEQFLANPKQNTPLPKGTKIPGDIKTTSLLIFVTPTLIDPAGNRINKPEDIPPGIPPQQQPPPKR